MAGMVKADRSLLIIEQSLDDLASAMSEKIPMQVRNAYRRPAMRQLSPLRALVGSLLVCVTYPYTVQTPTNSNLPRNALCTCL